MLVLFYFLSSRAALYFTKTADDDDDDDGGERKPCLPLNRENRERIFSSLKGCFFTSFLPFVRYFQRYFFATKRESKTLSLSPFFCLCRLIQELESFQQQQRKKFKNEKRAREREKTNHFFSPQQPLIYLFLLRATMETMNTTTTNKREGDEKDLEEDKKRMKKDELEEDELETQETHPWSANEEILEEEVYVQDLGKVSDDVKVVEAEKKSWNRKPLARPIDGQTDSIRAF